MVELQLDQPAAVNISLSNGDFDAMLYMRSACELNESSDACDDRFGATESLSFLDLIMVATIFVDGYAGQSGVAELRCRGYAFTAKSL